MATTSTAATATATLAAAAPASERERRPEPAGSAAKEAPSDIAGRPPSSPVSRPLLAGRACRARDDAAVTTARTSDAPTSVSGGARGERRAVPAQPRVGFGQRGGAAREQPAQRPGDEWDGERAGDDADDRHCCRRQHALRTGQTHRVERRVVGGRAGDEPAERLGDEEEAAERGDGGGDPQRRDADLDARDDGLADALERRDVEAVRSQDLLDLGGDRVEAVLVDAEVDERLDVGDVVGVGAGEALGELDDRERRLEVALGPGDGRHLDLDRRSVEGVAGSELAVVGRPLGEARRRRRGERQRVADLDVEELGRHPR